MFSGFCALRYDPPARAQLDKTVHGRATDPAVPASGAHEYFFERRIRAGQ